MSNEKKIFSITKKGYGEIIVKKSRFIGFAVPVDSAEKARELVKEYKNRFSDATHVVHAFRTGGLHADISGSTDDGEPSGTAGKPVLQIINGENLTDIIVFIIRYYGGTKLGTGGLVRAYSDCAKLCIENAPKSQLIEKSIIESEFSYDFFESIKNNIQVHKGIIIDEFFSDKVKIQVQIPSCEFEKLINDFNNITSGNNKTNLV